jgi:hypothetical protein
MSTPANLRGWGSGWPTNRQTDQRVVQARISGARWWLHHEIGPIWRFIVDEAERRGYLFDHGPEDTDDDWGFSSRPVRGTENDRYPVPSNHSWGLAGDIDAQEYPIGQIRRRPPQWIVDLFEAYGFEWGGRWTKRPDPMHFEFRGSVSEARFLVAMLAASHIAHQAPATPPLPPPTFTIPQEDDDMRSSTIIHITDPPGTISSDTWFLFDGFEALPLSSPAKANALHRVGVAKDVLTDAAGNVRPKPMTWGEFNGTRLLPGATPI